MNHESRDADVSLPIERLKGAFETHVDDRPIVLSSPTGSGKSTQVPRWCAESGRVLVIEPRRVACRALATRISELEGTALGTYVGYVVRDDRRATENTRIVFATPGVVLRMLQRDESLREFGTIILDEFHERGVETDLIMALLCQRRPPRFVVMSATIDGDRLAAHVGGVHLSAEGRTYPVEVKYLGEPAALPNAYDLPKRVHAAIRHAEPQGDILVFAPGKAEIAKIMEALRGLPFEVLALHGGLSLEEQSRVLAASSKRRIIVSTNVAETSLTVPSVITVIDSGLVRRTRYHDGRGYLTLMPVAQDSADQRAGRAGRIRHGTCLRLWGRAALLERSTPPEVHRESLVPLVLAALACEADPKSLPFPDPPTSHALEAAMAELSALGAIQGATLTTRGKQLFQLPLKPELGRLLVEAKETDVFSEAVDLVAALDVDRPVFQDSTTECEVDLRACGCDATALVSALRTGDPRRHGLIKHVLAEMRRRASRLRRMFGLPVDIPTTLPSRLSEQLAAIVLKASPRAGYIRRARKRETLWSNGGTEIAIDPRSALTDHPKAMIVIGLRSIGVDRRKTRLIATSVIPTTYAALADAGLGEDRLAPPSLVDGKPSAHVETTYSGVVLRSEERALQGELLRAAVSQLVKDNRLFKGAFQTLIMRIKAQSVLQRLATRRLLPPHLCEEYAATILPSDPEEWLRQHLTRIGLADADDLELLDAEDLLPAPVSEDAQQLLNKQWPLRLDLGDSAYDVDYNFQKRMVTLARTKGDPKSLPSLSYLPAFRGFGITVTYRGKSRVLRPR